MATYPQFRKQTNPFEDELKKMQGQQTANNLANVQQAFAVPKPETEATRLLKGYSGGASTAQPKAPDTNNLFTPQQQRQMQAPIAQQRELAQRPLQVPSQQAPMFVSQQPTTQEPMIQPTKDITQSEAYKTALGEARRLLGGQLPEGVQAGETAQLEALKKQQAEAAQKVREQYIQAGLGQSGAMVEGMKSDTEQQNREQIALQRQQLSDRAGLQLQQQQQGMAALQGLVGAEQAGLQTQSQEKIAQAELTQKERQIAEQARQFNTEAEFKNSQLAANLSEAEKDRVWKTLESEKARTSQERIAFADLDLKSRALAQEGMQFADRLSFDKWATQAGLDQKNSELIWQAGQNEKDRMLKENLFYKELGQKEKEFFHQVKMDTSKLDFEKYAFETGLKEAEKDRVWKALEAEKDRENAVLIKNMDIDIEKWKQSEVEKLTKLGWQKEEAMQIKDIEAKKFLQEKELTLQKEIEQGRLSMQEKELINNMNQFKDKLEFDKSSLAANLSEAEKDRIWKTKTQIDQQAWQSKEADLDRQLNKQIEQGKLTLQEKQLAQQAAQFKTEDEFKKSELAARLTDSEKQRVWQAGENAKQIAHEAQMTQLKIALEKEGLNMNAMLQAMDLLPPEQQAQLLQDTAKNAGLKYTENVDPTTQQKVELAIRRFSEDRDAWNSFAANMGITNANELWTAFNSGTIAALPPATMSKSGLKPLSPDQIAKAKQKENEAMVADISLKLAEKKNLTQEELKLFESSGQTLKRKGNFGGHETWDARDSSTGYKATRFDDADWQFVNDNVGKLITFDADASGALRPEIKGKTWILESFWEPGKSRDDREKTAFVVLKNPINGETIKVSVD